MNPNPDPDETPDVAEDSPYQKAILRGIQRPGMHVYAGTVPAKVVASRRAQNKVARASRRGNR
jgi:hypothetical protein